MEPIVARVLQRYKEALKYVPKETKKSKAERLTKFIRDKTGLSGGVAKEIADAIVRGRNLEALALQKNLPVDGGTVEGPKGNISVDKIKAEV